MSTTRVIAALSIFTRMSLCFDTIQGGDAFDSYLQAAEALRKRQIYAPINNDEVSDTYSLCAGMPTFFHLTSSLLAWLKLYCLLWRNSDSVRSWYDLFFPTFLSILSSIFFTLSRTDIQGRQRQQRRLPPRPSSALILFFQ